jgi:hypothetical protein
MNILYVTDSPIQTVKGEISPCGTIAKIETMKESFHVIFAGDVTKDNTLRGERYDLVMLPNTLEAVDHELHRNVYVAAKHVIGLKGTIRYY